MYLDNVDFSKIKSVNRPIKESSTRDIIDKFLKQTTVTWVTPTITGSRPLNDTTGTITYTYTTG